MNFRNLITDLKAANINFVIEDNETTGSNALADQTFVVSGVFESFSRDELKASIKANGGRVVSSISGNLNFVIAGDKMGPAKLQKATNLGVNIISEKEFIKMIESQ